MYPPESSPEQTTSLFYKLCYKLTATQGRVILGESERSLRQCRRSWSSCPHCVPNHASIHPLTHAHTHPPSHPFTHQLWPKPIYAALCQLPSFYRSNLNCVHASYQPTVNKAVPESNKWLMPDATTQLQHAVLSVQPAWAFNDPTSNLKVNSHWPGHFCIYPQRIFVCVCVSLLPTNFSIVWYAAACKMCRTSGTLLTPARANRLTQTPALAAALMWPLLLPTVATCFGHKYAPSGKPFQHIQTVRNAQCRFVSYLEISRFVQTFYGNWTESFLF